jgi:hypothetical protein
MIQQPQIQTAIPQHRYLVGNYGVTLLGEIASGDGVDYRYILAFVPNGQSQPSLYICCERNRPPEPPGGAWRMRLVNNAMSEVLEAADRWSNADTFAAEALEVGAQALGIEGEPVQRLL